ncbi:sigma-70 family RNA polymerase sigma factor [Hazenella sp. IB182357]|uniref:RNA polymerase sigma factor SigI n=1 Tax=Polycladospora coralii TaxID=2771432 RepID=A0A926NCT0_9BACL|nr:sigma-70 family RNA polymerase sigma factor [Polycladospora coralii]MBD1373450.1 sigma-70 family RNA polymerase sigma factor [Polycladospora coralii]MBS7531227.1 sigma-70 family RNA polymerase sigma factor [Polycladospora coralii]
MLQGIDLDTRVRQVQETNLPEHRNELLKELEPNVRRIASRICKRIITEQDDEYMICYNALNEAIEDFDEKHQSTFFTFANQVAQRRLIDYFRQERKHRQLTSLTPTDELGDVDSHPEMIGRSFAQHDEENLSALRQMEVQEYSASLAKYGLNMSQLVKKAPKHVDTRNHLRQVANLLAKDMHTFEKLCLKKRIPKERVQALGVNRRTLSRHRVYIIALTILIKEDFFYIRHYIGI